MGKSHDLENPEAHSRKEAKRSQNIPELKMLLIDFFNALKGSNVRVVIYRCCYFLGFCKIHFYSFANLF